MKVAQTKFKDVGGCGRNYHIIFKDIHQGHCQKLKDFKVLQGPWQPWTLKYLQLFPICSKGSSFATRKRSKISSPDGFSSDFLC